VTFDIGQDRDGWAGAGSLVLVWVYSDKYKGEVWSPGEISKDEVDVSWESDEAMIPSVPCPTFYVSVSALGPCARPPRLTARFKMLVASLAWPYLKGVGIAMHPRRVWR
jgi:hypothetical protein